MEVGQYQLFGPRSGRYRCSFMACQEVANSSARMHFASHSVSEPQALEAGPSALNAREPPGCPQRLARCVAMWCDAQRRVVERCDAPRRVAYRVVDKSYASHRLHEKMAWSRGDFKTALLPYRPSRSPISPVLVSFFDGDSFSRRQLDEHPGLLRSVIDLDLEHRKFGFQGPSLFLGGLKRGEHRLHPAVNFKAKSLGQDKVGAGDIPGLRLLRHCQRFFHVPS